MNAFTDSSTESPSPRISVVIPAFRGSATIAACLDSVRHSAASANAEIVVVESSGDGTAELVRTRFPGVRVIASPVRLSAGEARNVGFRSARGQLILCVDQDCVVPADWIARLTGLLGRPGVGAAGGSIAVANPRNIAGWCVYFLEFLTHFPSTGQPRDDNFLIGANSAWRAEVIRECPFPDQTLGEDLLASEAVRRRGFRLMYDPAVTVLHHNRSGWSEFLRYCRAMGEAAAASRIRIGGRAIRVLQRVPVLAYGIPLIVLPRIGWNLRRAPRGYLARYAALLPCCAVGQLAWANSFRKALRQARASASADR